MLNINRFENKCSQLFENLNTVVGTDWQPQEFKHAQESYFCRGNGGKHYIIKRDF